MIKTVPVIKQDIFFENLNEKIEDLNYILSGYQRKSGGVIIMASKESEDYIESFITEIRKGVAALRGDKSLRKQCADSKKLDSRLDKIDKELDIELANIAEAREWLSKYSK